MVDNEDELLRDLQVALSSVDRWLLRNHECGWVVNPDSQLADDDRLSDPFQLSHAIVSAIGIALDHAIALRTLVEGCRTCSPNGMNFLLNSYYSILRGVIENALRAVWLASPPTQAERVLRRLQLQADNVWNSENAAKAIRAPLPKARDVRVERIKEIARRAGVNSNGAVKRVSYSSIVRQAGAAISKLPIYQAQPGDRETEMADHVEALWRGCSGMAHGDIWAQLSLHDKHIVNQSANVATLKTTISTRAITTFTSEAFHMIDLAVHLFDQRNQPSTLPPSAN